MRIDSPCARHRRGMRDAVLTLGVAVLLCAGGARANAPAGAQLTERIDVHVSPTAPTYPATLLPGPEPVVWVMPFAGLDQDDSWWHDRAARYYTPRLATKWLVPATTTTTATDSPDPHGRGVYTLSYE